LLGACALKPSGQPYLQAGNLAATASAREEAATAREEAAQEQISSLRTRLLAAEGLLHMRGAYGA